MKLVHPLVLLALLTSSFDLFLVIKIGGTLRLAQVLTIFFILAAAGWILQNKRILWPRGGAALLLFVLLQAVLVVQWSGFVLLLSVQTFFLLLLTVLGIFAMLQLYGLSGLVPKLMRGYLLSFVLIAAFGIFQWVTPALHLGRWFVMQWIKVGVLPRLNGLSYEPSYFATYMLMGFITLVDLRMTKARLTAGRGWFWATVLVTAVLFLSTSKTAWLFIVAETALRLRPVIARAVSLHVVRFRRGHLLLSLPRARFVVLTGLLSVAAVIGLYGVTKVVPLSFFLAGSGLAGNAAHSVNDRANRAGETWQVFLNHPFVGLGVGGVGAGVAALHGDSINTVDDQRISQGFPVPLEVLAASGLVGVVPFVWFFLRITLGESQLIRAHWQDERAKWLHALIRALAFEWVCLLGDQFLLRVYVWFHVTMVVIVGYNLRYAFVPKAAEEPPTLPSAAPRYRPVTAMKESLVDG